MTTPDLLKAMIKVNVEWLRQDHFASVDNPHAHYIAGCLHVMAVQWVSQFPDSSLQNLRCYRSEGMICYLLSFKVPAHSRGEKLNVELGYDNQWFTAERYKEILEDIQDRFDELNQQFNAVSAHEKFMPPNPEPVTVQDVLSIVSKLVEQAEQAITRNDMLATVAIADKMNEYGYSMVIRKDDTVQISPLIPDVDQTDE